MSSTDPEHTAPLDIPPPPWHLTGSACVSLWRLPTTELPAAPDGMEYASVAGQSLLVTFWAAYTGGTASYDELAVAVPIRGQGMLAATGTIVRIWVDDPVGCEGGREHWRIPKQMAEFETVESLNRGSFSGDMLLYGERVASLRFEPRFEIPGKPSLGGFLVQPGTHGPLRTRCRVRGKTQVGSADWDFAPTGPLGFLTGRRPTFSARIWELQASIGI